MGKKFLKGGKTLKSNLHELVLSVCIVSVCVLKRLALYVYTIDGLDNINERLASSR